MSEEVSGYYFDQEKRRYFRIKGPFPGSSSSSSTAAAQQPSVTALPSNSGRTRARIPNLLQARELGGNMLSLAKGKCNFEVEYQKRLVSQPLVSEYKVADWIGDGALEQVRLGVMTPDGAFETDVLLAGGWNGPLSYFEVGMFGKNFCNGIKWIPDQVWPLVQENQAESCRAPNLIWRTDVVRLKSSASCIKLLAKHSPSTMDDNFNKKQHVMITTMGSDMASGSVLVLDCEKANASQAVIGTNRGAAVIDLETGKQSWGNVVLCGLRNGAIVTFDVRERPNEYFTELIKHQIYYSPRTSESSRKKWFQPKGNICPAHTVFMPSSICSLVSLNHYDQYFLASSMDGTIWLYDYRLLKRGLVQSYDEHVNSHTPIQLGVDPSERYLMSSGEDCKLRLWSIQSGKLHFEENISNSTPTTVCWGSPERFAKTQEEEEFEQHFTTDAWIRTSNGLFWMHWCF